MVSAFLAAVVVWGASEPILAEAIPAPLTPLPRGGRYTKCFGWWPAPYPYATVISQRAGYDYRREFNYPWSVRASYSLPSNVATTPRLAGEMQEVLPGVPEIQSPNAEVIVPPRAVGGK